MPPRTVPNVRTMYGHLRRGWWSGGTFPNGHWYPGGTMHPNRKRWAHLLAAVVLLLGAKWLLSPPARRPATPEPAAVQHILADPEEPSDDSPTPGPHAGDSPHAPASDLDAYKQPRCDPNDPMCGGL